MNCVRAEDRAGSGDAAPTVDFVRDIQPVFQRHCYRCHGSLRQESSYRLDVREVALGTADLGPAPIMRGDAQNSPLLRFVSGSDEGGIVMPPDDAPRLTDQQVALLKAWIVQGAAWPDDAAGSQERLTTEHWSFQLLQKPHVPILENDWVRNPIDGFVLAQLQQHGLHPSPDADRRTLIRRVYLLALGLPPSPDDVRQYVSDTSPVAYERLVDRVLASPRYGERWARHWLDVVRFAESHGFETNRIRHTAFPYRDYVIQSFNEDKPYDHFVREQLCGDAIGADAATGYLVAGPYDLVRSPDVNLTLVQRQDELADIVNTTGTTFLALTLGCARCHNHKFDPITQRDYYAVQAVFAGVNHGERELRVSQNETMRKRLVELRNGFTARQQVLTTLKDSATQAFEAGLPTDMLRPAVSPRRNHDYFPAVTARRLRFTISATDGGAEPCIDELEVYSTDGSNVALATAGTTARSSGTLPGYEIHQLKHVHDGLYGNNRSWISDTPGTGWVELSFREPTSINRVACGRDRHERFTDRLAIEYVIDVADRTDDWKRVSSSSDRRPFAEQPALDAILDALPDAEARRARKLSDELAELQQQISQLSATIEKAWIGTFQQPQPTYRLYRGDPLAPREVVAPDALAVLQSLGMPMDEDEQNRRARFADWVVSPSMPLTSRVIVNRLWQNCFGTGIVETPSDFGANGARPSHPLLLDWLAVELINNQWSLKHIHRLIMLSATFRQQSRPRTDALAADATARLLWRFPPRRMEAEAIRDSILSVSGSLDLRIGGPGFSLFEVQPENVYHYFPKTSWGPADWRRMIYATKVRHEQDAVFGSFDCPDGNQSVPRRSQSTTPLQALNLLNSQFVVQQSERLAARIRRDVGPESGTQVNYAFELLLGRNPDSDEWQLSSNFVTQHGLEAFCRAMLNANEFLFVF
jgi:hypothetical protein